MAVKKAYCFDFDETLVSTDARIQVYRNGAFYKELTSKQYNFFEPSPGDTFDFSEFKDGDLILNARKYKMWPILKSISDAIKTGKSISTIYILTARSPIVKSFIYEFFKQHGIDIDIKHIITIGDDKGEISISDEKQKILYALSKKYTEIVFFDDDPKNIALAVGIRGIRTRLVENVLNENEIASLSIPELLNLRKHYLKMFNELKMPVKRPKRDMWGNEIEKDSAVYNDLKKEYERLTSMIARKYHEKFRKGIVREDMGGVSAPISTPMNTVGMGNAVPPHPGTVGSGDKWDDASIGMQTNEENINPYDKLGMAMAKKMGVKPPFKKKRSKTNQNAMKQQKFEHQIITLDEFTKKLNENK
jgi:FMN phosphatase YigB (HAD superfamily)